MTHTPRKYMTPGTYGGEAVLIYIGSCKGSGCTFTARHLTWGGVDRLFAAHVSKEEAVASE